MHIPLSNFTEISHLVTLDGVMTKWMRGKNIAARIGRILKALLKILNEISVQQFLECIHIHDSHIG